MPSASYTYDQNTGNMLTKNEGANPPLTFCYGTSQQPSHPHAVTSVYNTSGAQCNSGSPWLTMTYDADGNLSTQGSSTYYYNANLLPTQVNTPAGQTVYWYDAAGTLVHRGNNANGTYTEYVGGIFEQAFNGSGVSTGVTKYYTLFGRRVAMRSAGSVDYLLTDHLGSTTSLLDSSGGLVSGSLSRYWPFGGSRIAPTTAMDKLFTGQQQEASDTTLNLYEYNARFYSTMLGHFIEADASTQDGYNRYMYGRDNPMRYNDPTGLNGFDINPCSSEQQCGLLALASACNANPTAPVCSGVPPTAYSGPQLDAGGDPCQGDPACGELSAQAYCSEPGADDPVCGSGGSAAAPSAPVPAPLCGTGSGTCAHPSGEANASGCGLPCDVPGDVAAGAKRVGKNWLAAQKAQVLAPIKAVEHLNNGLTSSCFNGLLSVGSVGVGVVVVLWVGPEAAGVEGVSIIARLVVGGSLAIDGLFSRPQSQPGFGIVFGGLRNVGDC